MSDDEYYYDSAYEDLHDILYDADPSPELADDLAEHTAYSPVWQENPAAELQTYFSDWEHYSDDYYDDDPKILKHNPQDGSGIFTKSEKRGRKRKLVEVTGQGHMMDTEQKSLIQCIQGTVWAQSPKIKPKSYRHGDMDKVALRLSDAVMSSAYSSKKGFGKGRLRRDDSWANDLSLADMGLLNERKRGSRQDIDFDAEEMEEVNENTEDDEGDEGGEDLHSTDDHRETLLGSGATFDLDSVIASEHEQNEDSDSNQHIKDHKKFTQSSKPPPPKRRRPNRRDRPSSQSPAPEMTNTVSNVSEELLDSGAAAKRDTDRNIANRGHLPSEAPASESHNEDSVVSGRRKRKITIDDNIDTNNSRASSGRKAKRAALEKLSTTTEKVEKVEEVKSRPVARATRNRKK